MAITITPPPIIDRHTLRPRVAEPQPSHGTLGFARTDLPMPGAPVNPNNRFGAVTSAMGDAGLLQEPNFWTGLAPQINPALGGSELDPFMSREFLQGRGGGTPWDTGLFGNVNPGGLAPGASQGLFGRSGGAFPGSGQGPHQRFPGRVPDANQWWGEWNLAGHPFITPAEMDEMLKYLGDLPTQEEADEFTRSRPGPQEGRGGSGGGGGGGGGGEELLTRLHSGNLRMHEKGVPLPPGTQFSNAPKEALDKGYPDLIGTEESIRPGSKIFPTEGGKTVWDPSGWSYFVPDKPGGAPVAGGGTLHGTPGPTGLAPAPPPPGGSVDGWTMKDGKLFYTGPGAVPALSPAEQRKYRSLL